MVAIFMIAFNQEKYIAKAIESVLMQNTNFPIKLFISEDCSTDKTRHICIKYKNEYPNLINLELNDTNLGVLKNTINTFNACFKSNAKYLSILEGDDYWTDENKLQKQVDFLESNSEYGMVAADVVIVNEKNEIISDNNLLLKQRIKRKLSINVYDLLETNLINTLTICVKCDYLKPLVKRIESENLLHFYDYWFWLNIVLKHKIKISEEKIAAYRIHSQGISSNKSDFLSKRAPLVKYEFVILLLEQHLITTIEEKNTIAQIFFMLLLNKNLCKFKKIKLLKTIILLYPSIFFLIMKTIINKLFKRKTVI